MRACFRHLARLIAQALLVGVCADVVLAQAYQSPSRAPPSWVQFAKLVKYRFEDWIGGDHPRAARFRVYVNAHAGREDGPPPVLEVKAWINPDGTIARVSFPPFKDKGATEDLSAVLTGRNVGERPPPDMLQPVNLRFTISPIKRSDVIPTGRVGAALPPPRPRRAHGAFPVDKRA